MFSEYGFNFARLGAGNSSGGRFASAEFRRSDRSFQFQEYMCSVLGKPYLSHYPGFSSDPLEAFRDLRDDLQSYCSDFLHGSNDTFLRRIEDARVRWVIRPKLPE